MQSNLYLSLRLLPVSEFTYVALAHYMPHEYNPIYTNPIYLFTKNTIKYV